MHLAMLPIESQQCDLQSPIDPATLAGVTIIQHPRQHICTPPRQWWTRYLGCRSSKRTVRPHGLHVRAGC